ncbi:DotU family type VI secretion system protein [Noviherbaspirillum malthae]|uniref:DotU family type VI secretion system protein n=1 Tax=Noviherbaspirillum malthae TaxID=1260987 RepID=UPI00188F26FA|nr:DotU family type VI secretion system protein [Noviherbaspirillum malthae]
MSQMPFRPAAADASVVRPTPGGRRAQAPGGDATAPRSPAVPGAPGNRAARGMGEPGASDGAAFALPRAVRNPLVAAASPLLSIAPQIRHSSSHPDPHRLKDELTQGLRRFEQQAEESGVAHATVVAARYVLCTFLDECAASTPWGSGGIWARDTLLVRLHSETWGGEKVFQLLARLAQEPAKNADLLELIYLCLSLGFEGRYRVADNGRSQLETIRERLYQLLREQRAQPERSLSVQWKPLRLEAQRWFEMTPLWVSLAFFLAATVLCFFAYSTLLNMRSDPVFAALQAIRAPAPAIPGASGAAAPAQPPAATLQAPASPRLRRFLEPEIAAGLVSVQETVDKSIITLRGDGLFEPGSAQISKQVLPLLGRIGAALREYPGTVLVDGHTDSQPIRSVRFPSNYHLSRERADGVGRILASAIGTQRIRAEGKADAEPVAGNDTPAGRAKNRRVTITLLHGQGGAS